MPKPGPKYTKWLVPARWGRPRQRNKDTDEYQPSRFWKDRIGFYDVLDGATNVRFADIFTVQDGEFLIRTEWVSKEGVETYDDLPLEHLKDYEPKLKEFDDYFERYWNGLYATIQLGRTDENQLELYKKHRNMKLRTVQEDELTDSEYLGGEDNEDDDDDQPPHKGKRIRKIMDDDDESDNPPSPLSNEWVRIGPSRIVGAIAGQDNGLIARKDIPEGTVITNYMHGATMLNQAQFEERYSSQKPTHVWQPKRGVYWDASSPPTLASSAMRGTSKTNNAKIMPNGNVKTTKPIRKDQEIFLPYGGTFRIVQETVAGPSILNLAHAQHSKTLYDSPDPAPPSPSILDTARAQHSGTMYEKAHFIFDMNPSDEESADDGDIPFGPMFRKRR